MSKAQTNKPGGDRGAPLRKKLTPPTIAVIGPVRCQRCGKWLEPGALARRYPNGFYGRDCHEYKAPEGEVKREVGAS